MNSSCNLIYPVKTSPFEIIRLYLNKRQVLDRLRGGANMTGMRLKLSGTEQSLTTVVSTTISGADSPELVRESIIQLFPDFPEQAATEPSFPSENLESWQAENISLATLLDTIHEQRILDTALDYMSKSLNSDSTTFYILRQASIRGKVAFPVGDVNELGGVIKIEISGPNLEQWLEAATWHEGRDVVPRTIGDELTMTENGDPVTWIQD